MNVDQIKLSAFHSAEHAHFMGAKGALSVVVQGIFVSFHARVTQASIFRIRPSGGPPLLIGAYTGCLGLMIFLVFLEGLIARDLSSRQTLTNQR